jgi:elongation factor 3
LDEPTGHLDKAHVDWLVDYINGLQADTKEGVTTVIVSHNAAFLDRVCTHIIHAHGQKLDTYAGNFASFMERVPDAQLGSASGEEEKPISQFVLPQPGALEGVRSQGKRFLCLEHVSYSYPKATRSAVAGATVECSLRSRVAIVGPNGAGKSTLAALVVGELLPDTGSAWRHPNLRMAFVAQHTFKHLEQHLDLTATQYILWRFEGNEDREALDFLAEEAEVETTRTYCFDNGSLVPCHPDDDDKAEPETIVDRRQRGRLGYEYEVKWRQAQIGTTWVPRWQLLAMGYIGMVRREDARQAAQHSLIDRPLTSPGVEMHLAGFGLDKEEASHRRLGALSNGQRARAVLGAATWLAPHLLVLDEPSNYLDPPALTALAAGLQSFGGGVIVISHNHAFLDEVCNEHWIMEMGHLRHEKFGSKVDETEADGVSAQKASANLAAQEAREKKKQKRLRELRRKNGEDVGDDEDEWWENLLKKTSGK